MTKKRKLIVAGAAAILLFGTVGALSLGGGQSATQVRIETAQRRDLVATVRASGWIRPRRAVEVQADIMGRVTELRVKEGDAVKQGDLLLTIDPTQYEAAVRRAEAGVSAARAREAQVRAGLLQAEQALQRVRALARSGENLVSPQAVEEAETQVEVQRALHEASKFDIAQAQAALVEARDRLSKTVIRAPLDGIVTRLNIEEGEMAIVGTMNNPGSLLLTISDLSVMEAVIRVDETDIPEITIGDSASIEIDAFPRRKFAGRVTEIGHSGVVPQTTMGAAARNQAVDFEVVIEIAEPPPNLRPDLSATAEVVTSVRPQSLSVPIIALTVREKPAAEPLPQESPEAKAAAAAAAEQPREDQEGVFVVREGKATFVPVEVGIAGAEHFEVLGGVAEGDSIVAGPYEAIRSLEEGTAVRALLTQGDSEAES